MTMIDNGLFAQSPKQLALPRDLSSVKPVFQFDDHAALADITSISFNSMQAQVAVIAEPYRDGVAIATYGNPELADKVVVDPRQGHLALSNGQRFIADSAEPYEVLIVLTVPLRLSLSTYVDFRGMIGIGGLPSDYLRVQLDGHTRFYAECVQDLKVKVLSHSIAAVGAVTHSLNADANDNARFVADRAYGSLRCYASESAKLNIRHGIGTDGHFMAFDAGQILHMGTMAGRTAIRQEGTGLMAFREVRTPCEPELIGSGPVSINGQLCTEPAA